MRGTGPDCVCIGDEQILVAAAAIEAVRCAGLFLMTAACIRSLNEGSIGGGSPREMYVVLSDDVEVGASKLRAFIDGVRGIVGADNSCVCRVVVGGGRCTVIGAVSSVACRVC